MRFMQDPPDQRGLSMVDVPDKNDAKRVLLLVAGRGSRVAGLSFRNLIHVRPSYYLYFVIPECFNRESNLIPDKKFRG